MYKRQIQYDDFIELYPYVQYPCAITSHFGYFEQPNKWDYYGERIAKPFSRIQPNVFCLSGGIKDVYADVLKVPEKRLFVTPNGVNVENFRATISPEFPDRSIYLAKIDYRKRQHMFQSISTLYFAGNIADQRFNQNQNYLGEWSKDTLYTHLTEYGNLVLLSDGEAHPLVCMEALAAGLGVVVSEWAAANLDTDREFITVIAEEKINDVGFVEEMIVKNRNYCNNNREEIIEYAKKFDWANVVDKYYVSAMETIIGNYK